MRVDPRTVRRAASALVLSAVALVGIAVHEDYRDRAYLPTPQDVPTVGFGSTRRADGTPVRPGDTTTPVRALVRLQGDINATETALHAPGCIGDVPLTQGEWDADVSLAYNIGARAFCASTLVRLLRKTPPDYAGACAQILRWRFQAGRELPGLVKRRRAEYAQCMGVVP